MKERSADVIVNVLGNAGEKLNADYIAGSTANGGVWPSRTLGGVSMRTAAALSESARGPHVEPQERRAGLGDADRFSELGAASRSSWFRREALRAPSRGRRCGLRIR